MRKRRSTVYVRPGKDVTLYVPTETPPEVIDYLNRLKMEGSFSQGVMDIVTSYVLRQMPAAVEARHGRRTVREDYEFIGEGASGPLESVAEEQLEHPPLQPPDPPPPPQPFDRDRLFRQALTNSGKLLDSRDND